MNSTAHSPCPRRLTPDDLPDLIELHKAVSAGLPAGFIQSRTEDELRAYLDGQRGVAYGIVEGKALVAMSLLLLPGAGHTPNGPPFPRVPQQDWPGRACFLEGAMVLAAARGRGYQRKLLDVRLVHAASARMRWACAAARLENRVSWANLLAGGMAIVGLRSDAGYPLLGLLRPLGASAWQTDADDRIPVGALDAAGHRAASQNGYIGVRLSGHGSVIYQRLITAGREQQQSE